MKHLKVPEVIKTNPELLKFVADLLQDVYPYLSYCEKCGLPWNACESKSVPITERISTFATCIDCWNNSNLAELQQYYANVYLKQAKSMNESHKEMDYPLSHVYACVAKEYHKTKT